MAISNFQRTVWSAKIQKHLETITSLKNHCDFQFEGDMANAKEIKILGVNIPTIGTYTVNSDITIEAGTDSSQTLEINQKKYFAFQVDDVDKTQSTPGLIEALSDEAVKALSLEADKYVADVVKTAVVAGTVSKASSTDVSGLSDGGVALIEGAFKVLYDNNCKPNDKFFLEVTPELYTVMRPKMAALQTDNMDLIRKGFIGQYNNALVSIENCLATWNDGTRDTKIAMLRTSKAVAFCGQINKVEAGRMEKRFADYVKGLYVFGAKVVRPEQVYALPLY